MHFEIAFVAQAWIQPSFVHFRIFCVWAFFCLLFTLSNQFKWKMKTKQSGWSEEWMYEKNWNKTLANVSRDVYFYPAFFSVSLTPYYILYLWEIMTMLLPNLRCLHRTMPKRIVLFYLPFLVRYFALNFISFESFNTISTIGAGNGAQWIVEITNERKAKRSEVKTSADRFSILNINLSTLCVTKRRQNNKNGNSLPLKITIKFTIRILSMEAYDAFSFSLPPSSLSLFLVAYLSLFHSSLFLSFSFVFAHIYSKVILLIKSKHMLQVGKSSKRGKSITLRI